MGRRMWAAILLPLPFAAVPIVVVMVGALFGSGGSEQVVLREDAVAPIQQVATDRSGDGTSLARVSSVDSNSFYSGCDEGDLLSES